MCNGELSQGSLMYVSLSQSELEVELPLSESSIMIASSVVWVCSGSTARRGSRDRDRSESKKRWTPCPVSLGWVWP